MDEDYDDTYTGDCEFLDLQDEDFGDEADYEDEPLDQDYTPQFADPGGNSALRAATPSNPRNLPCPNCGEPNRLTPKDVQRGYQCDDCADLAEFGGDREA